MVEEVQAWRAEDGTLHADQLAAARWDAIKQLTKTNIFNHASATAIVDAADTIVPLLQQVLEAQKSQHILVKPGTRIIPNR